MRYTTTLRQLLIASLATMLFLPTTALAQTTPPVAQDLPVSTSAPSTLPVMATLAITQPTYTAVGQPVSVPILLNTNGVAVNGIQLEGILTGAISEVRLESSSYLDVQVVKNEVDTTGFSLWLLPAQINGSIATPTATEIAVLTFLPQQNGTITLEFDNEATLVAEKTSSQNILSPSTVTTIYVPTAVPVEAPDDIEKMIEETVDSPQWYEVYFSDSFLPLLIVITAATLGGLIYWWMRVRGQLTAVTPQPSQMSQPTPAHSPTGAPITPPLESRQEPPPPKNL